IAAFVHLCDATTEEEEGGKPVSVAALPARKGSLPPLSSPVRRSSITSLLSRRPSNPGSKPALTRRFTQSSVSSMSSASSVHSPMSPPPAEVFAQKLKELLGVDLADFDQKHPLTDYGLDSLASVELGNWILEEYHVQISQTDLLNGMTGAQVLERMEAG